MSTELPEGGWADVVRGYLGVLHYALGNHYNRETVVAKVDRKARSANFYVSGVLVARVRGASFKFIIT